VYTSSILVVASNSTLLTSQRFLIRGGFRQNRAASLARLISRDRFSIPGALAHHRLDRRSGDCTMVQAVI
jgi:hypothetical protein